MKWLLFVPLVLLSVWVSIRLVSQVPEVILLIHIIILISIIPISYYFYKIELIYKSSHRLISKRNLLIGILACNSIVFLVIGDETLTSFGQKYIKGFSYQRGVVEYLEGAGRIENEADILIYGSDYPLLDFLMNYLQSIIIALTILIWWIIYKKYEVGILDSKLLERDGTL